MKKYIGMILTATMLIATLFVGCGSEPSAEGKDTASTQPTESIRSEQPDTLAVTGGGTLRLKVNPEINLDYDENGIVTNVWADNAQGEAVLSAVNEPVGMIAAEAVTMLVTEIEAQGYFVDEIEDEMRMVMLQFKAGSLMPSDAFAADVTDSAKQAVDAVVVTIGTQDYDTSFTSGDYITEVKAQEIALGYIGLTADQVVFTEREFDLDDGVAVYELECTADGVEYDIDVDAISGTVLKSKQKPVGEDDDDDTIPEGTYITLDQAKATALGRVGVAEQDAVFDDDNGLDRENGIVVYELEFVVGATEYELEINAETGEVVDSKQEHDDDHRGHDDDDVIAEDASYIGADKAKESALEHADVDASVATFDEVELDNKKGTIVYEVEFEAGGVEYDYHIDAVNGEILKSEQEQD